MNPRYDDIIRAAHCKVTTTSEWADGGLLVEVKYELAVLMDGTHVLAWVVEPGRFTGLQAGDVYAITEMVRQNADPGASVAGRKIRKNGTIEKMQHHLGHVEVSYR